MTHHVECPRCLKAIWHATGRFTHSRRGLRRAECRCEACLYIFNSARPEAIQAGEVVAAASGMKGGDACVGPERSSVSESLNRVIGGVTHPPTNTSRRERVRGFTRVNVMAQDYKKRAAGDDSEL